MATTWYEYSSAEGFFTIEFAPMGLRDDWSNAWVITKKGETISTGRDAEAALAALVASGMAGKLRLPERLIDWNHKRR